MTPETIAADPLELGRNWKLPDRGKVGVIFLIITESELFTIFVVAYLVYIGKSLSGP
jgi:cytochrome c oxidase subunit 3